MAKGSGYERETCKRLSLWWSDGKDDAVFWRSTTSGARATSRARKGLKTCNSSGDVCAIDPVGQPLLDLVTIEVKRGYNSSSIQDLLDKGPKAAKQTYQKWIETAVRDHQRVGSFSWMIITKRDQRLPLVIFPKELKDKLQMLDCPPSVKIYVDLGGVMILLYVMPLDDFLEEVRPEDVKIVVRKLKGGVPS